MRPGGNSHPVPRYNNKTYRVDEIDFTMNCLSTFVDHTETGVGFNLGLSYWGLLAFTLLEPHDFRCRLCFHDWFRLLGFQLADEVANERTLLPG